MRELEDALRATHAQVAEGVHPLLTEDLLKVKMPLQRETPSTGPNSTGSGADGLGGGAAGTAGGKEEDGKDVVDAFGSLSISQSGKTKFYGHTANSWVRCSSFPSVRLINLFLALTLTLCSISCR